MYENVRKILKYENASESWKYVGQVVIMLKSTKQFFKKFEDMYCDGIAHDIVDPNELRKSRFYVRWIDHEILRIHWHNFYEFAPNVYRSNHPTSERFKGYSKIGIKTIINLRGVNKYAHHKFEVETCSNLNLKLVNISLSARKAPTKQLMLELIEILSSAQKPFLLHCKSGADRTGLASAIYLMVVLGQPLTEAKKQLSLRYLHLNFTKTGILDYILRVFESRQERDPISFRDWVATEYNHKRITKEFDNLSFWEKLRL